MNRAGESAATKSSGLPPEILDCFAELGTIRSFPKDAVVVVEGEPAEAFYLVLDGALSVYVDDEGGKKVELTELFPGQYFGELMLGSPVRTASVKTMVPSRLRVIRRDEFEGLLRRRPEVGLHVIQTLIARIVSLTRNVRSLALMDVYGRVARLLLESARDVDGRRVVDGWSQQAIADRVGASRSMVNRILQDLSAGGYIAARRGRIELLRGLPKGW